MDEFESGLEQNEEVYYQLMADMNANVNLGYEEGMAPPHKVQHGPAFPPCEERGDGVPPVP